MSECGARHGWTGAGWGGIVCHRSPGHDGKHEDEYYAAPRILHWEDGDKRTTMSLPPTTP